MIKPILSVTLTADDFEGATLDDNMEHLCKSLPEYHVLVARGNRSDAKVLSHRRMKRADYQACVNAAKKLLSK